MAGLKRIVLAGAGHAHIIVLRAFAKRRPDADVTIINDGPFAWYTGALPALIRGDIQPRQARVDVAALAASCGARFIQAEYRGFEAGHVLLAVGALPFDVLAISIGGARMAGGVKPIPQWTERVRAWEQAGAARLAVIGAGPAGVELALALRCRLPADTEISLAARDGRVLPGAPPAVRRMGLAALAAARISIGPDLPEVDDCIHAYPPAPIFAIGPTLQLLGHDNIFATGDAATLAPAPNVALPRSGAIAVRQGRVLAHNLVHARLKIFRPPAATLAIMSIDSNRALAWRGRFSVCGIWPMRLKTWLDRRWVRSRDNS